MRSKILHAIFISLFIAFVSGDGAAIFSQTPLPENSRFGEVKISGNILAAIKNGDFVHPKFSPDGKRLAFANVLVEEFENTEVRLYDLPKQTGSILLTAKQAKKYAVYAAFVANFEWLSPYRLRASISDGDVDTTILTFNTQTRRILKTEYSNLVDEIPSNFSPLTRTLYKYFPKINRDFIRSAVDVHQAFKIGMRGAVIQFNHAKTDSNIWFLDFRTGKQNLLIEEPRNSTNFHLTGALEVGGNLLLIVENNNETEFYRRRGGKLEQIAKTNFGGWFSVKFWTPSKAFFILKQPNYEKEKPSSLWFFDGKALSRVSDVEELCDADIDPKGSQIAFCYWNSAGKREISVRKLKPDF